MESRTAFRGTSVSRLVVMFSLVGAAAAIGVGGAYALKALQPAQAGHKNVVVQTAGSAAESDSGWSYSDRHSGTQTVDGPAIVIGAPAFRAPSALRGGPHAGEQGLSGAALINMTYRAPGVNRGGPQAGAEDLGGSAVTSATFRGPSSLRGGPQI